MGAGFGSAGAFHEWPTASLAWDALDCPAYAMTEGLTGVDTLALALFIEGGRDGKSLYIK